MRPLPALRLTPIAQATPTRAEALRACPLHAAFDTSPEHRSIVLRGPAARLGTVCHEALEATALGHFDGVDTGQLAEALERLWNQLIKREQEAVLGSPSERHFGPANHWPYYTLKKAYLFQMVRRLVSDRGRGASSGRVRETTSRQNEQAEREYIGFGGKLRGRADHIVERDGHLEIEDYKTGTIFEESDDGIPEVKAGYRRQLLLYAALHWDETGVWPSSAHLISLQGERFSMDIVPEEALQLVQETLGLLDAFNVRVEKGVTLVELGTPSSDACLHCPYKLLCPPFWNAVSPDRELMHGTACVEGIVAVVDDYGERGRMVEIDVARGNLPVGRYRLHRVTPTRFPELGSTSPGASIRVVGARIAKLHEPFELLLGDYTQLFLQS